MGFDKERSHGWTKKLMKVPQLALDLSQSEASPRGTSATGSWSTRRAQARQRDRRLHQTFWKRCAISRRRLAGQLALSGSLQDDHFAFVNHHIRLGIVRLSTLVLRVNKTVDLEMRVAKTIRQEQWLPRIPPPGKRNPSS